MRTGVPGFDDIAGGGIPRGGVTVVLGGAGAGKTIFCMQILASSAGDERQPGILVAFEESAARIKANTASFVWGGDRLDARGVYILDAQLAQAVEQGGEFDLIGLLALVAAKAKQVGAQRVVFDGLDVLLGYLGAPTVIRRELFRLRDWAHESGMTAVVTAKAEPSEGRATSEYDFLQFLADCVTTLHHRVVNGVALRFIRVAKYRGTAHSANEFPFSISDVGVEVATSTTSERVYPASTERVSTGVSRLDAMFSGGYFRGTSILITGAPGTAKTSLASTFAEAAARRGERTVYLSFDESADQIARNVASIGVHLGPHVAAGTLRVHSLRARAESPEANVARIRRLLRDFQPQNLVIDPISALSRNAGLAEDEAGSAAIQLLDFAKGAGLTIVGTSLVGNSLPLTEGTPLNISTVADTWIHVSYVSQAGERNRALTIIKARGIGHSNQVREMILSDAGITLADVYSVGGEVLMGTLRWEKENEAGRIRAAGQRDAVLRQQKAEMALEETRVRLKTLAREQSVQEAELEQLKADLAAAVDLHAGERGALLERRRADGHVVHPVASTDTGLSL
jgi:circadian clock protein KaiC